MVGLKIQCPRCGWITEVPPKGRHCPKCKNFLVPPPEIHTKSWEWQKKELQKKPVAGIEQAPTEWMKCPKCKRDVNKHAGTCVYCGAKLQKSFFSKFTDKLKRKKPKKEKPEKEGKEEEPEKEEKKEKKKRFELGGSPAALIGSIVGLGITLFFGIPIIPIIFAIIGAFAFAYLIIPSQFKPFFKWIAIFGFGGIMFFFWWSGQFSIFASAIPPEYLEQIEETYYEIKDNIFTAYETSKCYTKVNPDLVEACLEELEEKEEEKVKKIGKNENLKLSYGREVSGKTFKNEKPDVNKIYNFYFMLKNENSEEYEINITSITVDAKSDRDDIDPVVQPGAVKGPQSYTLRPQETRPIRVEWRLGENPLPDCANNIDFLINITSIQKSGGGSCEYGLAPEEKGNVNYLHFFDPKIETNPGPLDIYVFTDPYAVNLDPQWYTEFAVVIKIKNKAEGRAFLDSVTLVQTFKDPYKYFNIIGCYDDENNLYPSTNSYEGGGCTIDDDNCFTLGFTQHYGDFNLTKDESKEILCTATTFQRSNLKGTYTDLMSVFTPTYEFLQEFKESKRAECGLEGEMFRTNCNENCANCLNELTCGASLVGCTFCPKCSGLNINQWGRDYCAPAGTDCGYDKCSSGCGTTPSCGPGEHWDWTDCRCEGGTI